MERNSDNDSVELHSEWKQRKYKKINYEERVQMIEAIIKQKKSYRKTGKEFGVSSSTVKMIVSKFEQTGTIYQRKDERFQSIEQELTAKENQHEEEEKCKFINKEPITFIPAILYFSEDLNCPVVFFTPQFDL